MKKSDARTIVLTLFSGYQTQIARISVEDAKLMVETYVVGIEDLTVEDCRGAVARALRTKQWLPTIAELRALVVNGNSGGSKQGAEAWGEVLAAVGRFGIYRTPGVEFEFTDPIATRVVDALGWRELCSSENQVADRARFIEAYDRIRSSARIDAAANTGGKPPPLPPRTGGTISLGDAIKRQLDSGKTSDDDSK